jgi:hypothetical protein
VLWAAPGPLQTGVARRLPPIARRAGHRESNGVVKQTTRLTPKIDSRRQRRSVSWLAEASKWCGRNIKAFRPVRRPIFAGCNPIGYIEAMDNSS